MTLTNITTYIAIRNSSASFLLDPLLCDLRYLAGLGQASGQADVALTMQRMPYAEDASTPRASPGLPEAFNVDIEGPPSFPLDRRPAKKRKLLRLQSR